MSASTRGLGGRGGRFLAVTGIQCILAFCVTHVRVTLRLPASLPPPPASLCPWTLPRLQEVALPLPSLPLDPHARPSSGHTVRHASQRASA